MRAIFTREVCMELANGCLPKGTNTKADIPSGSKRGGAPMNGKMEIFMLDNFTRVLL